MKPESSLETVAGLSRSGWVGDANDDEWKSRWGHGIGLVINCISMNLYCIMCMDVYYCRVLLVYSKHSGVPDKIRKVDPLTQRTDNNKPLFLAKDPNETFYTKVNM